MSRPNPSNLQPNVTCTTCKCKTRFVLSPIQKPPNPDCGCHCHEGYWMIHGEQFREEVRAGGKETGSKGPSASLRLLRGGKA